MAFASIGATEVLDQTIGASGPALAMTAGMVARSVFLSLLLFSVAGCPNHDVARTDPAPSAELKKAVPAEVRRDLDLLFVIDNSGSMEDEQESLARNFERFTTVLSSFEGGLPNVHIGVISTDMGTGADGDPTCSPTGDAGELQTGGSCSAILDGKNFLSDIASGDGERVRNYEGTLEEAFSCMARLGSRGCRYEQPLESMRTALDNHPLNQRFLRPDAYLAVVFITDEDDCSASDPELFSTEQNAIDLALGNLSSFRCFEFGVRCDPDDPRAPGTRQNCESRSDSPYLRDIDEYVEFLHSLKSSPGLVFVAGIIGNPTPVTVDVRDNMQGMPEAVLLPSCSSGSGEADPAVRLSQFMERFPQRSVSTTICNEDLSDALILIAELYHGIFDPACVTTVADLDPDTPGVQYDCSVSDVWTTADGSRQEALVPPCEVAPTLPCWILEPTETCDLVGGLELEVCRGGREDVDVLGCPRGETIVPPAGATAVLRCRAD